MVLGSVPALMEASIGNSFGKKENSALSFSLDGVWEYNDCQPIELIVDMVFDI